MPAEEAIKRSDVNANTDWKTAAMIAVQEIAEEKAEFTADDMWTYLAAHYPYLSTHDPRALGPIMRRAVKQKLCVAAGTQVSVRGSRNSGIVRRYRSLLVPSNSLEEAPVVNEAILDEAVVDAYRDAKQAFENCPPHISFEARERFHEAAVNLADAYVAGRGTSH